MYEGDTESVDTTSTRAVIPDLLDQLDRQLGQLSEHVHMLGERISPALAPDRPSPIAADGGGVREPEPRSALTGRLVDTTRQLSILITTVRRLTERVEL